MSFLRFFNYNFVRDSQKLVLKKVKETEREREREREREIYLILSLILAFRLRMTSGFFVHSYNVVIRLQFHLLPKNMELM